MLNRLKKALVESYVGAIALGWLFSQGILHFANIFAAPFAGWITRGEYRGLSNSVTLPQGFLFRDALPELVRCFFLLLVSYILLRWLYFKPLKKATLESTPNPEKSA
jgi:hypothetical protein